MLILLTFLVSIALSWFLTFRVRQYALAKNVLDIPNDRSSHSVPTPRGGGLALISVLLLSGLVSLFLTPAPVVLISSILVATAAFALLGWQDDKHDLPASKRFQVQLLIAAVTIGWLIWGGVFQMPLSLTVMIVLSLSAVWIVWMANLYNFMDGIDGLSAVESLMLGVTTSYWFSMAGMTSLAMICIAVAGASVGFMRWNWSPAKIFMGDVGSLALGAFFGIIAIIGVSVLNFPVLAFLILYAVYLADSGITLLRRIINRERWWEGHRSHFYQRAVQSGLSHAQVSLSVMAVDIIFAILASLLLLELVNAVTAAAVTIAILFLLMFLINSRFNRINSQ